MWRLIQRSIFTGVLSGLVLPIVAAGPQARESTQWQSIPMHPSGTRGASQIALERGGVLWVMVGQGVYYWDGEELRSPKGEELRAGLWVTRMVGGQDRELYVTQPTGEEHDGKIYRLRDGTAEYVTDCYFESTTEFPGLYVARDGLLVNWGSRFLSVYNDGLWQEHDVLLGMRDVQIAEIEKKVLICHTEKFYVIDEAGTVHEWDWDFGASIEQEYPPLVAAWGKNRILVRTRDKPRLFAFDVTTGQPVDLEEVRQRLQGQVVQDFFSLTGGTVWLRAFNRQDRTRVFYELSSAGEIDRIDAEVEIGVSSLNFRQFPQSILHARDGAVWLAKGDGPITRIRNGQVRRFDWRDGLSIGRCNQILEDSDGAVYVASHYGVAVWRDDAPQRPMPDCFRPWREFPLTSFHPIRDSQGHMWMLLADRPGEISRWDGQEWHHQAFPGSVVFGAMADDQGHVLLQSDKICFDVSREGVTRFEDCKTALIAARERGVKRMNTDLNHLCCRIEPSGEIWFATHNSSFVERFDGRRWDRISLQEDIGGLCESAEHGMLIRSQANKFYKYERGKLKLVANLRNVNRQLWSSNSFQPFESGLPKKHPRDFVAVKDRQIVVPVQKVTGDGTIKTVYEVGDLLPRNTSLRTLTRGWKHGHWTDYGAAPIYRILGGRIIQCEWQETPLNGREHEIRQVIEDGAGNLWMFARLKKAFMKRMDDFRVSATVHDDGRITIEPDAAWHGDYAPRVFWRMDEGPWQGGEPMGEIVIESDRDAAVEVLAMDRQGGTAEPIHITLQGRSNAGTERDSQ